MGHLSSSSSELNAARSVDVPSHAPSSAFSSSSSSSPEMQLRYMVTSDYISTLDSNGHIRFRWPKQLIFTQKQTATANMTFTISSQYGKLGDKAT